MGLFTKVEIKTWKNVFPWHSQRSESLRGSDFFFFEFARFFSTVITGEDAVCLLCNFLLKA